MCPPFALLSYWGAQLPTYGGAIHQTKPGLLIDEGVVAPNAMAPFGDWPVYVANEAFRALRGEDGGLGGHHGWAECSLVMAENVLVEKSPAARGSTPPSITSTCATIRRKPPSAAGRRADLYVVWQCDVCGVR